MYRFSPVGKKFFFTLGRFIISLTNNRNNYLIIFTLASGVRMLENGLITINITKVINTRTIDVYNLPGHGPIPTSAHY